MVTTNLQVGEVVHLRCDGIRMMVTAMRDDGDHAEVVWMDINLHMQIATLPVAVLDRVG